MNLRHLGISTTLVKFASVGGVGFLVDASVLTFLSLTVGLSVVLSRFISFGLASAVTWYMNKQMTFASVKDDLPANSYWRYVLVQIGGAAINLAVFMILLQFFPAMKELPVVPLAIGAVFGLAFNYILSKFWVFKARG